MMSFFTFFLVDCWYWMCIFVICCCLFDYYFEKLATTHTNGPSPWTFISFTCLRFQGCTRKLTPSSCNEWVCGHLYWWSWNRGSHDLWNEPGGNQSWIEKVSGRKWHNSIKLLNLTVSFFLPFFSSYQNFLRLYTQLEYLKNKTLRQDNPHISKRRGGRKVAHRRFSLQVKYRLVFFNFAFTSHPKTPTILSIYLTRFRSIHACKILHSFCFSICT